MRKNNKIKIISKRKFVINVFILLMLCISISFFTMLALGSKPRALARKFFRT